MNAREKSGMTKQELRAHVIEEIETMVWVLYRVTPESLIPESELGTHSEQHENLVADVLGTLK